LKIAIVCDSVLLKKSLEIFLKNEISDFSTADIVISDRRFECNKPLLLIGNQADADIKKPFGKVKLLSVLDNYEKELNIRQEVLSPKIEIKECENIESTLEEQIGRLTHEFSTKLIAIIRANNER